MVKTANAATSRNMVGLALAGVVLAALGVSTTAPAAGAPLERDGLEQIRSLLLTAAEIQAATGIPVKVPPADCYTEPTKNVCGVIYKAKKAGSPTPFGDQIQSFDNEKDAAETLRARPGSGVKIIKKTPTQVTTISVQPSGTFYGIRALVGDTLWGVSCKKGPGTTTAAGLACARALLKAQLAKAP